MKGLKAEEFGSSSDKAKGFAKGFAKGIWGVVAKPTAGACDLAAATLVGVAKSPGAAYSLVTPKKKTPAAGSEGVSTTKSAKKAPKK